ncbi:D-alanyl-D-alanine carboxypeptidase [Streptomyces sp. NPDC002446]
MKETSVAGESPDKSDKKQSSGETARSERDPRLSVFRGEPDEPAKESGAKPAAESEVPEGTEGAEEASGDGEGAKGGDERLRAAVAAWVAEKGDEDGDSDGGGDADGDDGGDADDRAAGSDDDADRAAGSDGDADGAADASADASADVSTEAADEVADDASAKKEREPGKGSARESESEERAAGSGKAGGESQADGDGGSAESGAKADAKDEAEADVEVAGAVEPKVEAKPEPKAKPESKVKPKAEAASESEPEAASEAEPEVVDQPTAVFKTVGPQKGKPAEVDAEAGESAVDDATRVFAIAKSAKGKGASAEPVDQATAVFKVPPSAKGKPTDKKPTDKSKDKPESKTETEPETQPETKGGEAGPKGGAKGDTKDAPERDAERTSQFVALKSADDDGTAGRSLGKTAPKTPATRTPDKAAEKAADKLAEKPAEKPATKPAAKPDEPADKAPGKGEGKGKGESEASGGARADRAPGSLSSAAPAAKPTAAPQSAGRPGAMPPAATGATAGAASGALPESERTKQQPLPPLDLLAKLTNTPPPPETTLRTVVRRFKIWTPLAVLLAIIFVVVQAVRPLPAPMVVLGDAKSSFTFEGGKLSIPWPEKGQAAIKVVGSGELGTFGEQKPVPTASVAKIMTAYVILKEHPLKKDEKGPEIEVDAKAVAEGGSESESRIEGLKAGQKFSQQDMIKMLMIPSGNNIARLLARWDTKSGNEAAFVKKMNDAAKDLGMTKTTYTDPSGLDSKTVSTAVDQLKLAEAVMKFEAFRPVVAMPNAKIPGLPEPINNNNDNLLLAPGLSIKGIKTGSSTAAGGTLSWAAYKTVDGKDRLILGTMMDQHFKGLDPNGSNSLTMVKDNSKTVIEAVREALTSATAVKKGQVVGYVDDGLGGLTPVVATKDLKAIGVPGQKLKLSIGNGGKTLPHEVKAGTKVGVLTVGNGESTQKVPVALQKDLVEPGFGAKLTRLG